MRLEKQTKSLKAVVVTAGMILVGSLVLATNATAEEIRNEETGGIQMTHESNGSDPKARGDRNGKSTESRSSASASASASASTDASSKDEASKDGGECSARASATARATADGKTSYEHREDHAEDRADRCSAKARSSATARSGESSDSR